MHTDHSNHYNATLGMHTGSFAFARPSIGSWVSYGLGTENRNLPSFVVIAPAQTYAGSQVYASDFLPGAHQGTLVVPGDEPVANIAPRVPIDRQELELAALAKLNRPPPGRTRADDALLAARIKSFETAFGMQMAVPDAFDLSQETDATLGLYGLERGSTKGFAWQCLVGAAAGRAGRALCRTDRHRLERQLGFARRHDGPRPAGAERRPARSPGLLKDLKARGLLDETLVVWTTEFGRTPFNNSADAKGREHHNWAFSSWLAGAGVKPGIVHGETDEYGIRVAKDPVHVHDFHATILHLMGLDHERLTYRHSGRDYRLTDVHGRVVRELLA